MIHFTLAQKKHLQILQESGHAVIYVTYNPSTVIGTPELDATNAGYVEYYRESNVNLEEIIYTK